MVETTRAAQVAVFRRTVKIPIIVDWGESCKSIRIVGPEQTPDIEFPILTVAIPMFEP